MCRQHRRTERHETVIQEHLLLIKQFLPEIMFTAMRNNNYRVFSPLPSPPFRFGIHMLQRVKNKICTQTQLCFSTLSMICETLVRLDTSHSKSPPRLSGTTFPDSAACFLRLTATLFLSENITAPLVIRIFRSHNST